MDRPPTNSMETILTFENRNISQWSAMWSTANITAADGPPSTRRFLSGRLHLRLSALSLGAFLTMHCKLTAAALTGGFFIFAIFLVLGTVVLANPLRHFEVYLGQWSLSGPGRAFRILPMFDGIGIAMCINAIIRAITCCTIAAISAVYLVHSVSDETLPFTYCRDFQLKPYKPILKEVNTRAMYENYNSVLHAFVLNLTVLQKNDLNTIILKDYRRYELSQLPRTQVSATTSTVGIPDYAWRNITLRNRNKKAEKLFIRWMEFCNENYTGLYPALFNTPAYNFFYVEVVHLRSDYSLKSLNLLMVYSIITTWLIIWATLIAERLYNRRLTWNRMYRWLVVVPWIWNIILIISAIGQLSVIEYKLKYAFRVSAQAMFVTATDALDVAIYIHAACLGTEIIHGKGLNHYASGHIDPFLNNENVWHSIILSLLAGLHSGGAAACAFVDYLQFEVDQRIQDIRESTLWVIPMYSKCITQGSYSHLKSSFVFGGLTFSYMTIAYTMIKTAMHTIFEYKVKLVYCEQFVAACLILTCMGFSLFFATNGGIVLLESLDLTMTTVATPMIALLELVAMLYVYRSHDFRSDMNLSMEENACGSRMDTQWHIIPFVTFGLLASKLYMTLNSELPTKMVMIALIPVILVVVAIMLRTLRNIYVFFR
ncbi:sodium- and chloride-dependent neutral and basic amino acid transporter B(0+) [Amyelois transitella]|uniref:sodium- and chloride-dependent neutral and basic amino acid transporter B(0+) n=1 Tax=Amyelois transitella TaxID=680683 RepID=UPI00298F92B1|nr:sodium- and chloride-dependent neutral and basic amino acid transporter B(0+) [Amyelois transitella]